MLNNMEINTKDILSGEKWLFKPPFASMTRDEKCVHALMLAYIKLTRDDKRVSWDEVEDIMLHAIVNKIGDKDFKAWLNVIDSQKN
jgi:hypothetical protein